MIIYVLLFRLPNSWKNTIFAGKYNEMIQTNFHTHTTRCGHATGTDEEYVVSAIKGGYRILGFSDHTPWKYASDFVSPIRMDISELPEYTASLRYLKEKYKEQIDLKIGLECEYFTDYIPWLKEVTREAQLDYLIFGNHFYDTDEIYPYFGRETDSPKMLEMYEESTIRGMESGLFAYLGHPDLFMRSYFEFDNYCEKISRKICQKAYQLNIPLEYNIGYLEENLRKGVNGYPHPLFWKIAKDEGCTAIIGMDAHDNKVLENNILYNRSRIYLKKLGIKTIDKI